MKKKCTAQYFAVKGIIDCSSITCKETEMPNFSIQMKARCCPAACLQIFPRLVLCICTQDIAAQLVYRFSRGLLPASVRKPRPRAMGTDLHTFSPYHLQARRRPTTCLQIFPRFSTSICAQSKAAHRECRFTGIFILISVILTDYQVSSPWYL